jgi:electron transport complex protein RnfD
VTATLIPAGLVGIFVFGPRAFWLIVVCVLTAVLTEAFIQKGRRVRVTISDGSAVMTGLLLAYNLPAHTPLWIAAIGSIFAMAIAKHAFGGLGRNIFNPALAARAFLLAAWPKQLTTFTSPFVYDAVTQATPLAMMKEGKAERLADMGLSYMDLFIGNRGGCVGEVCVLALILGGIYLLYKKLISWHTPVYFIGTVAVMTWIFAGKEQGFFRGDALFHLLSGGLMLGAIYMATDYVTSPITRQGQVVYAVGCGFVTSVIRIWGGYPEGVCYSILIMNAAVPMIDRYIRRPRYGTGKTARESA